jgi:hypothetical protein
MFSPHKVASKKGDKSLWTQLGRIFATDSFISLRGTFAPDQKLSYYLLYPLVRLPEGSVLFQNMSVRHDLHLLPAHRSLNLRFRWEETDNDDRLISNQGRHQQGSKQELLLKYRFFARHLFESEIGREQIDEKSGETSGNLIEGGRVMLGFTTRQAQTLELKMAAEYEKRDEQMGRIGVKLYSLSPQLVWSLLSQGRLRAQLRWTHLSSAPKDRSLPYVLTGGKRQGENYDWRLFFDYKWNRHLVTSVAYSGESIPQRDAEHRAKAEVKALF